MMMTNPMIGPWSLLQHSATGAYDLVMSPGKAEASGSPCAHGDTAGDGYGNHLWLPVKIYGYLWLPSGKLT